MSARLHPCPSCTQHLRASETVCPFCDASLPAGSGASARPLPPGRPMSRAALLFVTATAAASCGGSTEAGSPPPADGGREAATDSGGGGGDLDGQPVALYGPGPIYEAGPRPDAGPDAPSEASPDGGMAVMYGPATVDGG
jgi:hypothetical protein